MDVLNIGPVTLYDYHPVRQDFLRDVVEGLSATPPRISSKYFYDETGSALFEQITKVPEYYLTRTELSILREHLPEMAAALGPRCVVVEPGSGSGMKTRLLLSHLVDPVAYVPVEISREYLIASALALAEEFPELEVLPVCDDYFGPWLVPEPRRPQERNVVFFPGSTIGNMQPDEARGLLASLARRCGQRCGMLIGVDLKKDPAIIAAAYNDSAGVTRAFNLNLVERLNRELGAGIPAGAFEHATNYNELLGRNESFLVATRPLTIGLGGSSFHYEAGARIMVENSYKFSLEEFAALAADAGLRVVLVWMDERQLFSVQYLTPI
jgi:dimethylhistidine N-methyltransferase